MRKSRKKNKQKFPKNFKENSKKILYLPYPYHK